MRRKPGAAPSRRRSPEDDGIVVEPRDEAPWQAEDWVDEGPVRAEADAAVRRARPKPRQVKRAAAALEVDEAGLKRRLGTSRGSRTMQKLAEAADAYADERYEDARRVLRSLAETLPREPAVRELYGLALYRLGRYRHAVRELTEFHQLSGNSEQHPVLADCHRALGQHGRVAELWAEIADESLTADIVAEGRIVYAGSLADQGDLQGAIAAVEAGNLGKGAKLEPRHLRLRYVLADLYERGGDLPAARRWFESIAAVAPDFADVRGRLRQL